MKDEYDLERIVKEEFTYFCEHKDIKIKFTDKKFKKFLDFVMTDLRDKIQDDLDFYYCDGNLS